MKRSRLRVFVAGTDTGVGKTEVACGLLRSLAGRGLAPVPFKPYESGCDDLNAPSDALALQRAALSPISLEQICPHRFKSALAPGLAAQREGRIASFSKTLEVYQSFENHHLVVEGAGGLRVPVDDQREIIDLISAMELPVLLVARSGLGTLNHIALSVEALRTREIAVAGVLLCRSTPQLDEAETSNAEWLNRHYPFPILGPVPFERDSHLRLKEFCSVLDPWVTDWLAGDR